MPDKIILEGSSYDAVMDAHLTESDMSLTESATEYVNATYFGDIEAVDINYPADWDRFNKTITVTLKEMP